MLLYYYYIRTVNYLYWYIFIKIIQKKGRYTIIHVATFVATLVRKLGTYARYAKYYKCITIRGQANYSN